MDIVLTNLSNRLFEESRHRLNASARKFGIGNIRSYDIGDIRNTTFYQDNKSVLDLTRGMGYWLWKPYIIREALRAAKDGDIVVYADSGLDLIAPLDPLFEICRNSDPIVVFGNGEFPNSTWTKRDCFILMDCDSEEYWRAPQCDAAFCLFRREEASLRFVETWLEYCRDPRIVTDDPNTCGRRDLPDFVEHRHDQSILSLLAAKNRISLFRMPTQFGNHYKTWPFRVAGEFNCVSQVRREQVGYYATIPYYNSPYLQLLDHHRGTASAGKKKQGGGLITFFVRVIGKRWRRWKNTIALRRELRQRGQTEHRQ
jgi:hypothetical protein